MKIPEKAISGQRVRSWAQRWSGRVTILGPKRSQGNFSGPADVSQAELLSGKESAVAEPRVVAEKIVANVERVIVGKRREVELAVTALMCGGHVLIEDVPGVGKTKLARSIARSTGCIFRRIQFTPALLPTDVTGVSVYNQKTGDFEYR